MNLDTIMCPTSEWIRHLSTAATLEVSERNENVTCPAAGLYMIPITGRNAMSEVIVYQVYAWWHVTVITSTSFDQCPPEAAGIKDTLLAV